MHSREPDLTGRGRKERQRTFWRQKYAEDPEFFGEGASEFARWCLPRLRAERRVRTIVDLGCGYGRDSRFFGARGFHVRGIDVAGVSPPGTGPPAGAWVLVESDCTLFLRRQPPESVDAVYSNMLFNMDFTEAEHRRLIGAVRRVLRPGGLHLYSARSTTDPWYGRGRRVGPDCFDPTPHGITMHYFSKEYIDRLGADGFEPVTRVERSEGEQEFPIRLWYVVDRKLRHRSDRPRTKARTGTAAGALRNRPARRAGSPGK